MIPIELQGGSKERFGLCPGSSLGFVEHLGEKHMGIGHFWLGDQGFAELRFGCLVLPHFVGQDSKPSFESGIAWKGSNGAS